MNKGIASRTTANFEDRDCRLFYRLTPKMGFYFNKSKLARLLEAASPEVKARAEKYWQRLVRMGPKGRAALSITVKDKVEAFALYACTFQDYPEDPEWRRH